MIIRIFTAIGLIFFLAPSIGFGYDSSIMDDGKKEALVQLVNMYEAKDFPLRGKDLERCREKKSKGCLLVFKRVKKAKEHLFQEGRESALTLVLDTIKSGFMTKDWWEDMHSRGAVCALSLFTTKKEDQRIFQFFKAQGPGFLQRLYQPYSAITMFSSNRPDKSRWIDYINTLEGISSDQKYAYKESFNSGMDERPNLLH